MPDPDHVREDFVRLVRQPEPAIDLARAALLIAAESDPNVDVEGELRQLEAWGRELQERLQPGWNNLQKLARLRSFVYEHLGFRGDQRDYYSPRNSLLHEVLRRRRGIPLTMGIVMMELGWRVGMPLEGVGFPGHFLVRLSGEPADLLLDPYLDGRTVHEEDCRRMLQETTGGQVEFGEELVVSVGKLDMIERLLRNLKSAYLRQGDDQGALAAVDRLLLIVPEDANEIRDRGLLLFRLNRWAPALECLTRYLERKPDAADRDTIREHVLTLRYYVANLN